MNIRTVVALKPLFRLNTFRPLLREAARDYDDDDESDHAVVYLGEPIHSGYVLISGTTSST